MPTNVDPDDEQNPGQQEPQTLRHQGRLPDTPTGPLRDADHQRKYSPTSRLDINGKGIAISRDRQVGLARRPT